MELSVSVGSSVVAGTGTPPAMGLACAQMINHTCTRRLRPQLRFCHRLPSSACLMMLNKQFSNGTHQKVCRVLQTVSAVQCAENPSQASVSFKNFQVSVCIDEDGVINIRVNVGSTMTGSFFEKVFSKHLAAAQPLPGFRQMKGGKTPNIPKEVALHLIGPSKVTKATVKKIINYTVAEYVQKENLNASKNLRVLQSYEELEAAFEPGKEFYFDAAIHLQ